MQQYNLVPPKLVPAALLVFIVACGSGVSTPEGSPTPAAGSHGDQVTTPPKSCPTSTPTTVRTDIMPGLGRDPVWMISAPSFEWLGADGLHKIVWIVSGAVEGEVRITGARLDGPDEARFTHYDGSWDVRNELILAPHDMTMDRRGYIIFPRPGCWEFTIQVEGDTIETIVLVLASSESSRPPKNLLFPDHPEESKGRAPKHASGD